MPPTIKQYADGLVENADDWRKNSQPTWHS